MPPSHGARRSPNPIVEVEAIVLSEPRHLLRRDSWDGTQDDVIIRVTTEDGTVGVGEVDSSPQVVAAAVDAIGSHNGAWGLRELLVGQDAIEIGPLMQRLNRGTIYFGRSGAGRGAISGVEIALWDIAGQILGLPVHTLLGGPFRTSVRPYASLLASLEPEETAAEIATLASRGFTAFKLGGGPLGSSREYDEALVHAAREASPHADLMLDLAYEWETPSEALRMTKLLERFALTFVEEPLAPDDLAAYEWLTRRSGVPIAAGEAETDERGLLDLVARRAVDIVQPDISRCGGLRAAQRVAWAADAAGMGCVLHCWKTGILKAASLHLSAAVPKMDLVEYCVAPTPLQESLTLERFALDDEGRVPVSQDPGLGIRLNPEALAQYATGPLGGS